jgi:dephospho-CoA kinase
MADIARGPYGGADRLVIGLTGGIGSGKSAAAHLFEGRGAGLVDTDAIAHALTRPGQPALQGISARFGAQYLTEDGALDRARLRSLVFADAAARRDLEAILHPLIRGEAQARVRSSAGPYVVIVVPLLVETGGYRDLVTRVLVVDCSEALQVQRTMQRSGLDRGQVLAIMQTQASRSERLVLADDVLHNDGTLSELAQQVDVLHARYCQLAKAA